MADDLVNYLVTVVCSLIIGAACHSFWGHWMQRRAAEAEEEMEDIEYEDYPEEAGSP